MRIGVGRVDNFVTRCHNVYTKSHYTHGDI